MKIGITYYGILTPDGDLVCGHNSETNGLYSTVNRAQAYLNKLIAQTKKCIEKTSETVESNPLNTAANIQLSGWLERMEAIKGYRVRPLQINVVTVDR